MSTAKHHMSKAVGTNEGPGGISTTVKKCTLVSSGNSGSYYRKLHNEEQDLSLFWDTMHPPSRMYFDACGKYKLKIKE